jgi:hypothetical protein
MPAFIQENILFFASAVLLVALLVGAAQLQRTHGADMQQGTEIAAQVDSSMAGGTQWQIASSSASESVASQTTTPVTQTTPVPAVPPHVRARVYNRERDDN